MEIWKNKTIILNIFIIQTPPPILGIGCVCCVWQGNGENAAAVCSISEFTVQSKCHEVCPIITHKCTSNIITNNNVPILPLTLD